METIRVVKGCSIMTDIREYNREYAKSHRKEILEKRKNRYWTDPLYRESLVNKTRKRRIINRVLSPRIKTDIFEERVKVVVIEGKSISVLNRAAFARKIGVTRITIDNWHKWGILPMPPDVDDLGRCWYREDYINAVDKAVGKYKIKMRREVLADRVRRAFAGELK